MGEENDLEKLEIVEYNINFSKSYGLKLAVVADLHERPYDDIFQALLRIKPSLILLPGDTLERRDEGYMGFTKKEIDKWQNTSFAWKSICWILKKLGMNKKNDYYAKSSNGISFIKAVSRIAPVVMSVGNHEWYFTDSDYKTFEECGVVLLDNSDRTIEINDKQMLFGGLSTRYDLKWLELFMKKKQDKILLCHHPEYCFRFFKSHNAQLIVSGHAHGGQIRLFGHGLFAPGQGLFPKYTKGLRENHLISTGVANTAVLPRFGNPREICIVNIN